MREYTDYVIASKSGKYLFSSYEEGVVALISSNDIQYCHIFHSEEEANETLLTISKAECFFCEDKIHKFANLKVAKLITKVFLEDI